MLPERGIASFYNSLNRIVDIAEEKNYTHDVIVVDTGFHIANLFMKSFDGQESHWLDPDNRGNAVNHLHNARLIVWFLWTLTALERPGEIGAIYKLAKELGKYKVGKFDKVKDFCHIFNPFALYPRSSGWLDWFGDDYRRLLNVSKKRTRPHRWA